MDIFRFIVIQYKFCKFSIQPPIINLESDSHNVFRFNNGQNTYTLKKNGNVKIINFKIKKKT